VWRGDTNEGLAELRELRAGLAEPSDDAATTSTSPLGISLAYAGVQIGNIAEPIRENWRAQIAMLGGPSPLLHFVDAPTTRIELTTTHPGGLAQFITGKKTLLSSLIRDELALRSAKNAAALITERGNELALTRGLDTIHLAIGLAEWKRADTEYRAPVLLQPLAIRRYGRDFELRLGKRAFLNPALQRELAEQFSITLDAENFVALAHSAGAFTPQPMIDRLRGLTSHLGWFNVQPRLIVSSFAEVGPGMLSLSRDLEHPVLDALAGNPTARSVFREAIVPAAVAGPDHRAPSTDTLLLDADAEQDGVIAQIAAGRSIVVRTLPGTGATQTIVNAIGALVGQHKRVLVVSPRRSSLTALTARLAELGLPSLATSPDTLRRDLVRSILRNERAVKPQVSDVDEALVRLRTVLLDYRQALTAMDPALGVSVLDALQQLASLSLLPTPPTTTARLTRPSLEALATGRDAVAQTLVAAARLGEFRYGPGDSPWVGAEFSSPEDAERLHGIARRLHDGALERLLVRAGELVDKTRLRPFETMAELGVYLRMLLDIRDTLDRFQPLVFDRSVAELITATGAKRDSPEMSSANRRRLRKLAKEYVRPGVHITDLHAALSRIQQQRVLWQRFVIGGSTPQIPTGIADVQVAYQQVLADLEELEAPLGSRSRDHRLTALPLDQLRETIAALAADSEVMDNLHERTVLLRDLRDLDLAPLLRDLSDRHIPESQVGDELELAWWQSVLEDMLVTEKALLGANTYVLDRLEADFRMVDQEHAAANARLLGWQLAQAWSIGIVDYPEEAAALRSALKAGQITTETLQRDAPHLARSVAPVWLSSPYLIDAIGDELPFDAVFVLDGGATTLAENVPAIRRGRQVVVFGDTVTQYPEDFQIGLSEKPADRADHRADSVLESLTELLPVHRLTRSYRGGGADLTDLISRRFYDGAIASLPWAGTWLGHSSLHFDYVASGNGLPDPKTGAVESVEAEVERVVQLALEHAQNQPGESLMVVTPSAKHASRVEQAVLTAFARRPDLIGFLLEERAEPLMVTTIDRAVAESRDRVIFSLGYGRTPHGRVLTSLGALSEENGERLLALAMTRARKSMTIVSCFEPGDIDDDRMQHGIAALGSILHEALERRPDQARGESDDALLRDLAHRLETRGVRIALGYHDQLGLVASFGGKAAVIETDASLVTESLRETLRLRPYTLFRLGWHYVRVHSFELFSNPDAVADRIAAGLGAMELPATTQPIPVQPSRAHAS